jgi:hypothetical protein
MSYLQMNARRVNKNKSREIRLRKRSYILLGQWMCERWNKRFFEDTAETLE